MKITVKNKKTWETEIKQRRAAGWQIITFWKRFCEMEKGNAIITIEY